MYDADYKKLSLLIAKYCPDFVVEDHPKFISFLKAYYDWSMNVKEFNPWRVTSHLIEWGDIDETIDEFIDYFKEEYLNNLNVDFNGDIREFIKHTKEFYSSRGTPESFKFLLQLLSGNVGEIFYPNKFLMKSSDGEWVKDRIIFAEYDDTVDQSYISTKIRGMTSGVTGIIEDIETHFNYSTQQQFLKIRLSNLTGLLPDDDVLLLKDDSLNHILHLYNTVQSVNIAESGNNYKLNDNVSLADDPTFIARVSSISSGAVDSYAIFDGGSGYGVGDELAISCDSYADYYALPRIFVDEVDSNGSITSLDLRYPGYGFYTVPVVDEVKRVSTIVKLYAWRTKIGSEWGTDIVYTSSSNPKSLDELYDEDGVFLKKTITSTSVDDGEGGLVKYITVPPSTMYNYYRNNEEDLFVEKLTTGWRQVPETYIPLHYIDSTNDSSYFETNVYPDHDTSIEIKERVLEGLDPDFSFGMYGSDESTNLNAFSAFYKVNDKRMSFCYGTRTINVELENILDDHIIKQQKNRVYIDNQYTASLPESSFTSTNKFDLFAVKTTGSRSYGKIRLYYAKIFNSLTVLKYYIPVKRVVDSTIGLYDIINDEFLTDTSGGTYYVAGPEYSRESPVEDAQIELISFKAGGISGIDVVSAEINYENSSPLIITSDTGVGASATITTGKVFTTIPYYYKPGSFLSDDFKLQDSDYWQEYSYEIRSSLALDSGVMAQFSEYRDIFKKLVHPAGFKLFNSFILSNHISLNMLYVNSTIDYEVPPSFIDFVNWIEMVSSWNRIVDSDIIWQYRLTPISTEMNTEVGYYQRTGGEFVHSTIEVEE